MNFESLHSQYKQKALSGRYITLLDITPLLQQLSVEFNLEIAGYSVLNNPIYKLKIGSGKVKILLWSQMHGNESTTTKALFDFINLVYSSSEIGNQMLSHFTFCCLPMLNPDGAKLYTRENFNKVDLNRDSQNLTQPESNVLRTVFEQFQPDYCYNLHDQRTIFGTTNTNKPATISFLAPSYNENRDFNNVRLKAVDIIVAMNNVLSALIPDQIGRFDDGFNINCIGDTFQSLNVPTILFEAGHYHQDYEREITRKYVFIALMASFDFLIKNDNNIVGNKLQEYLNIPQNKVYFYDIVYKNVKICYDNSEIITNFAIQFKEELVDQKVIFNAYIVEIGGLEGYLGHYQYEAQELLYSDANGFVPIVNQAANFKLGNKLNVINGVLVGNPQ